MLRAAWALFRQDLRLAFRRRVEIWLAVGFFMIALALFPLGIGPGGETLARIGAGVIWVLALLAVLLSLDRLFQNDFEDGTLDRLMLAAAPLEVLILAKCAAHWLATNLLLVLISPLAALFLAQPFEAFWAMPASLLLGTPTLTLIGSIGAALLTGSGRGGVLAALLVLPLYIPVLIFGVGAVDAAIFGLAPSTYFLILGAILLLSVALAPFAAALALRAAME
ncbi:MAG: heme exporter protein CcmB [Pseudomonadota bacterium]